MIEKVIDRKNIRKAYHQVRANKGSAGVDGMSVNDLPEFLKEHQDKIATAICTGQYLPQPILGIEIPKSNGKKRLLGVPTVVDRVLQQAVSQVIGPKFELQFKEHSYGFRPNRNALQAVKQSQKYINAGYQHIVDIDLKGFFDEVDHCLLLQLVYRKVKCPLTMRLIRKWLRAPIKINGKLVRRRKAAAARAYHKGVRSHRFYPISCSMNWTRRWKRGGFVMSAMRMTLVSILKVNRKLGR